MNKETYARLREEDPRRAKQRRETELRIQGKSEQQIQDTLKSEFAKPQRVHNRRSRRPLGLRRPRHRNAKKAYAARGQEYRDVLELHRELHLTRQGLRAFIHQAARKLSDPADKV